MTHFDGVVKGDTVREVLAYVQYNGDELLNQLRKDVERAVRDISPWDRNIAPRR